ncbi:helix-turn-helix transcriptional regulator [Parapedobacter sp.]
MEKDIYLIRETVADMHRLLEELVELQSTQRQCCRAVTMPLPQTGPPCESEPATPPGATDPATPNTYVEEELMTVKEAEAFIPASRTKIYKWRKEGKLHTVSRGQRHMRLIRTEVEAMQQWAIDKGKR